MVRKHEGVMCRGVETMQCGEGRESVRNKPINRERSGEEGSVSIN